MKNQTIITKDEIRVHGDVLVVMDVPLMLDQEGVLVQATGNVFFVHKADEVEDKMTLVLHVSGMPKIRDVCGFVCFD